MSFSSVRARSSFVRSRSLANVIVHVVYGVVRKEKAQMKSNPTASDLLERAQKAFRATRVDMATRCGVGRTTFIHWVYGEGAPKPAVLSKLAADVFEVDKDLAAELAACAGITLETLGLGEKSKPPRAAPPPTAPTSRVQLRHLADSVVLAVAEMLDRSPNMVRPMLIAAFERADVLGLTVREAIAGLREGAPTSTPPRQVG
jgi:hypothetical protein